MEHKTVAFVHYFIKSAPFLETAILLAPSTALVSPPKEAPVTNPLKSIDNSICETLAESRQTITPQHWNKFYYLLKNCLIINKEMINFETKYIKKTYLILPPSLGLSIIEYQPFQTIQSNVTKELMFVISGITSYKL